MVIRPDALDVAQRPRPEACARAVGDAEVHRHADEGDLQIAEVRVLRVDLPVGRVEQGRHPRIGRLAGSRLADRSEEHTSELQSIMRTSYAVFCLKKQNKTYTYSN